MLKVFRDNLKSLKWVLWAVIAVFILFIFLDFGSTTAPGGTGPVETAARVGKHEISYAEFERSYRAREDFFRQTYGDQFDREAIRRLGLPLQVLNELIDQRLLWEEAKALGLEVTDTEVREAVLEMPVFQRDGRFVGWDEFEGTLRANRYTPDQFWDLVRSDLVTTKVRTVFAQNVYVSEQEVEEDVREQTETATIRFVQLGADAFTAGIEPDEGQIESWFAEHREDFELPERRAADYLLVSPQALRASLSVSDEEIADHYNSNIAEFTSTEQVGARHILLRTSAERDVAAARSELEELRERIEAGEDFAALAAEFSDDPGSRERGGDLGFFGRGQMVKPFEEAAFGATPGSLVGPVETGFGVHLIEVTGRRPGGQRPLAEARAEIEARLLGERANQLAESTARELTARLRREGGLEAMDSVATEVEGVTRTSTELFAREDSLPGIGRSTPFHAAAFELDPGAVSDPVRVGGGWAVLAVTAVEEPRLPELSEVRDAAVEAWKSDRALQLAEQRLAEAADELGGGTSFEDVAESLGLEIQQTAAFNSRQPVGPLGRAPELAKAALALDAGEVGGPVRQGTSAILFEVTARSRYSPEDLTTRGDASREQLRQTKVEALLSAVLAKRREQTKVTYDTALLESLGVDAEDLA